jgi:hypothetical protein
VCVLDGPESLKGKKVCVDLLEYPLGRNAEVTPAKEEMLYFVAAVDRAYRKRSFRTIRNPEGPVYLTHYRLPAALEKDVLAALRRRDGYPIVSIQEGGEKVSRREVFAVDEGELCHFDVSSSKVLARRKFEARLGRDAALTEDGKEFFVIDGGIPRSPRVWIDRVNVESGKATRGGEFEVRSFTGNDRGLVPGGKFFYIGDPGFYLFDRQSLKPVTSRAFRGTDSLSLHFTRDGSRFAVVTGGRIFVDRNLRQWDPGTQSVVRIHQTQTGRTLGAFPASTRGVSVKFSPDGKRLAVSNDDGTFEVWDLSALDRL